MSKALNGNVYLVTGASSGFGLAIARALLDAGARLGLLARSSDKLVAALASLSDDQRERAMALTADVADSPSVDAAVKSLIEHFGRLDGVVNNAGVARPGTTETYTDQEIQQQLQINIAGTLHVSRAAIPHLKQSDNPRILNISSASAEHHDEMHHLSLYAASKAAVERLSRDLRREMQEYDIGVTVLRPGAATTNFADGWDFDRIKAGMDAWHKRCGPCMDTGMDDRHVAESVLFCLSMDRGVSVDLLEIRPNRLMEKFQL